MRRDPGFVLVNALVVIAALSALAVGLLADVSRGQTATALARQGAQTALLGEAGAAYAAELLRRDFGAAASDHPGEPWALRGHVVAAGDGSVAVSVEDLQGRFNLNLLAGSEAGPAAEALARLVARQGGAAGAAAAVARHYEAVATPDAMPDATREGAAAGGLYRRGDAGLPSELPGAEGLGDPAAFAALPRDARINVNTARPEVLAALLDLDAAPLAALLALRAARPFDDLEGFAAALEAVTGEAGTVPGGLVAVGSSWFEVRTEARLGELFRRERMILARDAETGAVRRHLRGPPEAVE